MTFDDYHAHTNLSYCCEEEITPQDYVRAIRRGRSLRSVAITNHGFAIYFPEDVAWRWESRRRVITAFSGTTRAWDRLR